MRLVIQIPCLNEQGQIGATIADLPRRLPGVDEIELLIIDDGSSDGTVAAARAAGAHYILLLPHHRGLAVAFSAGLNVAYRLGADILVNTDADGQYRGQDIAALIAPIIGREADIVVGDRQTDAVAHFSWSKRLLQRWGSRIVRTLSGTDVADSPSGFRAFSRRAMAQLFVHNRFTYTLETIIQAGQSGLAIRNVKIEAQSSSRPSRLFHSTLDYVRRALGVVVKSYAMYRPVQAVGLLSLILFLTGAGAVLRFLYFRVVEPEYSGYTQSLVLGVGSITLAFLVGLVALLGELLAANRRLLEEVLVRVRQLESRADGTRPPTIEGLESTGQSAWAAVSTVSEPPNGP